MSRFTLIGLKLPEVAVRHLVDLVVLIISNQAE